MADAPTLPSFEHRPLNPAPLTGLLTRGSERYELYWVAGSQGHPGLNADLASGTEATREPVDRNFEVLGVNMTSALSTYYAEGGITLTTAGADGDEAILLPHLDTKQSGWAQTTWGTDRQVEWEAHLQSGANITNAITWAGLKLTNTEVLATDADQVFFRYEDDVSSGALIAVYSIGGTDTSVNTGITWAVSTKYRLRIAIDSSRIARFYVGIAGGAMTLVATSTALTDAIDLIPYIGVAADGAAAAKAITVFHQSISRQLGVS